MAGQADAIFVDSSGDIVILDWKRTASIKFDNAFRSLREPLQHLSDSNGWLYGLKLFSLFARMRAFSVCGWNKRTSAEHLPLYAGNRVRHAGLQHVPGAGSFFSSQDIRRCIGPRETSQ